MSILSACIYTYIYTCTLGAHRHQKRASAPQKEHHVIAGNQAWVLWKSCKCSESQTVLPASAVAFYVASGLVWFGFGFGLGWGVPFCFILKQPCYTVLLTYKELRLQAGPYSFFFFFFFVFQKLSGHCPLELALDFTSSRVVLWETLRTWGNRM
jgi:hypothetical protein